MTTVIWCQLRSSLSLNDERNCVSMEKVRKLACLRKLIGGSPIFFFTDAGAVAADLAIENYCRTQERT